MDGADIGNAPRITPTSRGSNKAAWARSFSLRTFPPKYVDGNHSANRALQMIDTVYGDIQFVTSNEGRGGRRYLPYAFTEQGIAMLSGVLTSKRAVDVNIAIMHSFVRLRQLLATHEELARRLDQLEWRQSEQDTRVQYVFEAIQNLTKP